MAGRRVWNGDRRLALAVPRRALSYPDRIPPRDDIANSASFHRQLREQPYDAAARAVRFISVQTITHSDSLAANPADRRREPRRPASGKMQLKFESEPLSEVEADLMDVSASGFRASHRHGALPLGAKAAFRHPEAAGKARVVWNWMSPDHVETGFVIIR
jgi:hypothetical protein